MVRHGESLGNLNQLCFGQTDFPLTDSGIKQAEIAREKLATQPFVTCYTSGLTRAITTAEIVIQGRGVQLVSDARLNEQYMGKFENKTDAELLKRYPTEFNAMMEDWTTAAPVGGEAFEDMYTRVCEVMDEILRKDRDALIVAHNGSLSMGLVYLLGLPKHAVDAFYFDYGTYSMVDIQPWGRRLRKVNY
jgi:broad specificity phosphatase PhoE